MSSPSPVAAQRLQQALGLMNAGRMLEAVQFLGAVTAAEPGVAVAHRLLGEARTALGDLAGAETSLREAVRLARRDPHTQTALGELLVRKGATADAEKALRAALATDRRFEPAVVALSTLLLATLRAPEALQVTTPLAAGGSNNAVLLQLQGQALQKLGRHEDAIAFYRRAVAVAPGNGVAEHNLASAHGDAEQHPEAEAAARRAFQKGVDTAETWLVLARALLAQGRYEEAEAAFREAICRSPQYNDAHEGLARLIWMRTADLEKAQAPVVAAIKTYPGDMALKVSHARLLEAAGEQELALTAVAGAAALADANPGVLITAAQMGMSLNPVQAMAYAQRAVNLAPGDLNFMNVLCAARLASGDPEGASKIAGELVAMTPNDQLALASQATAWRMLGDPRYDELYDYGAFVRSYVIDTPDGWPDLKSYLADLTVSLNALHGLETHPVGQSLRHGSQTSQSLKKLSDPAIKGFFQAIDGPIRRHMAELGKGRDPVRRRNKNRYDISGIWSVRLKSSGFHVNHVHPQGWFSSACYINVPKVVDAGGHEGWIQFGEPGPPTSPPLPAEHYVKPEPGLLVLFPSYMWHGTVPFTSDERRMTVAFDVVPG